jgi:hypothetical protein
MPCNVAVGYQCFGGLCHLHLQGEAKTFWRRMQQGPPKHWYTASQRRKPSIYVSCENERDSSSWGFASGSPVHLQFVVKRSVQELSTRLITGLTSATPDVVMPEVWGWLTVGICHPQPTAPRLWMTRGERLQSASASDLYHYFLV